ncbi:MAG TPA: metal ABC transporter permease [Archaeoglobus profundus]|nr:metal ABC transporter permease [Archaeoglobus profundus]
MFGIKEVIKVIILALIIFITITLGYHHPKWVAVIICASLIYGVLSPIISARKLYFLSIASSHSALLAVVLAIPLAKICLNEYLWSILIGISLLYCVCYAIEKGIDIDVATAIFVSFTSSASVIAMYLVLTNYPVETDLWSIILGDPLLVNWYDVYYTMIIAIITVMIVLLTYREQVSIGIEKDCATLSGINVKLYDILLYTILGIATISMIKIVGFVLQHVLIALPSAISMLLAKNSKSMLITSIVVSLTSGLVGLNLAILTNQAPSGVIGLLMFGIYVITLIIRRWSYE